MLGTMRPSGADQPRSEFNALTSVWVSTWYELQIVVRLLLRIVARYVARSEEFASWERIDDSWVVSLSTNCAGWLALAGRLMVRRSLSNRVSLDAASRCEARRQATVVQDEDALLALAMAVSDLL